MFKGHPKGLFVLFFSNMGERFGYYTMFAILVLYMQDHFGWTSAESIFLFGGVFLTLVSALPVLGGIVADAGLRYGRTVLIGLLLMLAGYGLMAIPLGTNVFMVYAAIAVIALGVGLFKGNLVVILGNLYEDKKLSPLRDRAFNIFYMGINLGAVFAPHAAMGIKEYVMGKLGYIYNTELMSYARDTVLGREVDVARFKDLAASNIEMAKEKGMAVADMSNLTEYAQGYYDSASMGYNLGFGIAALSMVVSLIIYLVFKKHYKHADYLQKDKVKDEPEKELTPKQVNNRLMALGLIFFIVIFFWMALMLGGGQLTDFAKNYVNLSIDRVLYLLYSMQGLLSIFGVIVGLVIVFEKSLHKLIRMLGFAMFAASGWWAYTRLTQMPEENLVGPEIFQTTNPFFIIILTFPIVAFFTWLSKRGKEPDSPVKIGIGMFITFLAFASLVLASNGLPNQEALGNKPLAADGSDGVERVSAYYLIIFYFLVTVGELFLSPIGMSYVSKISPPKMRGTMQALWLATGAIATFILGLLGAVYEMWEMSWLFGAMAGACLLASALMFIMLKKVTKAASS